MIDLLQQRDEAEMARHGTLRGSPMRQKWLHTIHVSALPLQAMLVGQWQGSCIRAGRAGLLRLSCLHVQRLDPLLLHISQQTHGQLGLHQPPVSPLSCPAARPPPQTLHLTPQQKQQLLLQREAHLALMRRIYQQRQQLNMQARS